VALKKTLIATIISISTALTLSGCSTEEENQVREALGLELKNVEPNAVITGDLLVDERSTVTFDAYQSDDDDGRITGYEWSLNTEGFEVSSIDFESDDEEITINIGEIAKDQTITLSLTVTDNDDDSTTTSVEIVVDEVDEDKLPPQPTAPADGLLGTDIDNDGVRDDIEADILKLYPLNQAHREVARHAMSVLNTVLEVGANGDDVAVTLKADQLAMVVSCVDEQEGMDYREYKLLRALMLDTEERLIAFDQFNRKMSGKTHLYRIYDLSNCALPQN
jgi:hypothetical protein